MNEHTHTHTQKKELDMEINMQVDEMKTKILIALVVRQSARNQTVVMFD